MKLIRSLTYILIISPLLSNAQLPVVKPENAAKLSLLDERANYYAAKNLNRFALERLNWYDVVLDSLFEIELKDTLASIEQNYLTESSGNIRSVDENKKLISELTIQKEKAQDSYNKLFRKALIAFFIWLVVVTIVMQLRRTRVKRAQLALETGTAQASRMANLNTKASELFNRLKTISHSVNEINAISEKLKEQISPDEAAKAETIAKNARKEQKLIGSLLDQEFNEENEKLQTNINELCDVYVEAAYRGMLRENNNFICTVSRDFEKNLPQIKVDQAAIGALLLNILSNAFNAVQAKSMENIKGWQPKVAISTRILPRFLQIRIRDNGNGMNDEQIQKAYTEFYTTLKPDQGAGLGLFESKRIISELHKGEIKIESEKGNSTDVYIKFFL